MSKIKKEEEAVETPKNKELADFSWDDGKGSGSFFKIEEEEISPAETKKEEKDEETPEQIKAREKEEVAAEEEENNESFFEIPEGKLDEDEDPIEEEDIIPGDGNYNSFAEKMKEAGILSKLELEEGAKLSLEDYAELQDEEIEARVDETFAGFFEEMDDDGTAFLKHKKDGGSTADFFKAYNTQGVAPTGDLDDEAYQEKLSRFYYKTIEKDDAEDIDDKIEWLKTSGKLEKYAERFDKKIKDTDKAAKEELVKANKARIKAQDESRAKFNDSVQEALDEIEEVNDFKFTKDDKKNLLPFITKASVKVGKNQFVTPMQSKLGTALKDPQKMLILAQLLHSDFDITPYIKNAGTADAKKLQKNLQRKDKKPAGTGRVKTKRSLADAF